MENLNGHAWVADGYKNVSIYRKIKRVVGDYGYYRGRQEQVSYHTQFYYSAKYLHMNWGWGVTRRQVSRYSLATKLKQGDTDGWCTYDYWTSGYNNYNMQFNYYKYMIMVTPP